MCVSVIVHVKVLLPADNKSGYNVYVLVCLCVHQVCREYQRGNCTRGENDCRFAHPSDSTMIDTNDNTVTVCMDYIKGRCSREKCKYFHPPAHLQAKIKAAQHQVNQAAAAAAMVGFCPDGPIGREGIGLRRVCCSSVAAPSAYLRVVVIYDEPALFLEKKEPVDTLEPNLT